MMLSSFKAAFGQGPFKSSCFIYMFLLAIASIQGFSTTTTTYAWKRTTGWSTLYAVLRRNVEIPLLELGNGNSDDDDKQRSLFLTPLPSSNFPDELATPFLYGLQINTALQKLVLEEATSMALTTKSGASFMNDDAINDQRRERNRPMYGQLVWKDSSSDSLVGAIGCTAEILVNVPTRKAFGNDLPIAQEIEDSIATDTTSSLNGTPPNTVLCRGGFRFVVKQVLKTIPFPVVIVDEIQDDADVDDSDMFFSLGSNGIHITSSIDLDEDDDDDDDDDELVRLSVSELIQQTMVGVQNIISSRLDDAVAKNNLSPLEKAILEDSGLGKSDGGTGLNPAIIELAHAEEMAAVWEVFQASLVDDIDPKDRRFAVAIMAAELTDMRNGIREKILLTRSSEERLRIVLRELNEIDGMARAKKIASKITDEVDELDKNLKVGKPQLPPWALRITKGTKIEYFWNEEYGWCTGEVIEEPVTIFDEILLTIRFDDGEIHKLPLMADEKVRWRPG